jgi:hypothetical protein
MKRKMTHLFAALAVAGFVSFGSAAHAGVSCHGINARGTGQDLGGGVTQAQIRGGGLLNGTSNSNFVITGVSGTVASFTGVVLFTVNKGTLAVSVNGTFDLATGRFQATSTAMTGTGKLEGAAGNLTITGLQDLETGTFTEDVTGEICVDLSPKR